MKLTENEQIYIVDDDASVCRALATLLTTYGFNVTTFTSALEFFDAVPKSVPGCLILDINMPSLDGWDTLQLLSVSRYNRPVIIISADKTSAGYERAMEAGAAGYLQKPFDDQALVDLIKAAEVEKSQKKQELTNSRL